MANNCIISVSLEPQIDTSETVDGIVYSYLGIEGNVGTNGGKRSTAFADSMSVKYVGDVEDTTAALPATALLAGFTTAGTIPSTSFEAFYVRLDGLVGSPTVSVQIGSKIHAVLTTVGDTVCIPCNAEAIAGAKLKTSATYNADTSAATVTCVIIGN
tara:strand:- start:63 stop:533 length:471 start_codon:yes stop_codon:yes gene_type:complete